MAIIALTKIADFSIKHNPNNMTDSPKSKCWGKFPNNKITNSWGKSRQRKAISK